MIGTVKVITVTYLEDDIYEGSIPRACYDNADIEHFECDDFEDAVRVFEHQGLSFAATNSDWAALPDGSYVSDYGTGERTEVTAHLEGFSDAYVRAVIAYVD